MKTPIERYEINVARRLSASLSLTRWQHIGKFNLDRSISGSALTEQVNLVKMAFSEADGYKVDVSGIPYVTHYPMCQCTRCGCWTTNCLNKLCDDCGDGR